MKLSRVTLRVGVALIALSLPVGVGGALGLNDAAYFTGIGMLLVGGLLAVVGIVLSRLD